MPLVVLGSNGIRRNRPFIVVQRDKRKSYFRTWIETLKHIFFLDGRYSSLLAKYPLIDCSNISTTSNMALSQFLFTKLEASSRDQVRSCLNDHLDGVELLKYLQQNYGATTIMDCTKALQRLKDTTWEYQDTVDTFSNRFLRRAETYRVTLRSTNSPSKLKLEDEKLLTMYLVALSTTMPSSHPLHQTVQTKFVELESCITAGTAPSFKFIQVMHQMRHLETINLNNTTSTRQSYNKVRPRNQSRPPYVKANTAAESTKPSNQANLVTQSRKFEPVKCWGCGHHHNLRDCPTTSDEQKQALYQQQREEKERRTNGQPNRSAHQQANKADTPKSEATPTTETSNPKNTVHKVTEMPRRRGTNFAAPVKHFSGMTRTLPHTSTLDREALKEMFTLIRDWLIDSGCTAHMSPVREDFIGDLEPHQTMVEVANGSLVEVQWRGTVKLLLIDKFDRSNQAMVYLRNVLYVPMLSRRLLSVAEWNQCGGQINFLTDKCRVQILDSNDFPIHTIDIDPIYAADEINNDRVLTVSAPKATPKKIRIEQELLHQRLGHRAISTLLLADEDDVWADVKLIADDEKFCETCKITTARRAKRGSTPLEQLEEVVPGMCIMVDLVKNPVTESITSNSYFPFYLTITDMASRFFVPMGIRKKTSHDVFVALQEWATSYGPGIDYTMHMMRRIHGDYDSAFRSEELRSKFAQFNIKISFAAPRHQEQNGIHEANWRNIRNLAFAMMNQARVPKKFFHFAFEHAWKIHAVLLHKALTRADGKVQTPLGVYEGKPVGIESFRVLFCPVVMTYDSINLRSKDATGKQLITSYNRRNNPQRAIRGIHVGLPRHNTGYLVFVPQLNSVLHCNDVYFDENFESTLAYTQSRHPAHLDIVVTDAQLHVYDEFERTSSALWFCNKSVTHLENLSKILLEQMF
ncbi:integrase core domain containing protein [Nitzschia inconspicua]|uniref:Integrase core domain containing protein n=1 Tax=Nitzschia inconspicua TaxID=303405 RepID=A0A9K3PWZ3_9STRA|nr:integrase core domain containing protein [Nitzschia inconspicua]